MRDMPPVPPQGWTQQELADYLDIGLRTVQRYTHVWPHHREPHRRQRVRFMAEDIQKIRDLWYVPVNQQNGPDDPVTRLREQRRKRVS